MIFFSSSSMLQLFYKAQRITLTIPKCLPINRLEYKQTNQKRIKAKSYLSHVVFPCISIHLLSIYKSMLPECAHKYGRACYG